MKLLNKLPNSIREAPGLEWAIFKKLPATLLLGTLVPLVISVSNRLLPPEGSMEQIAKHIKDVDILLIATAVTIWTAVLTIAIGCVVVILMKGPAYVADAYDMMDSETPARRS